MFESGEGGLGDSPVGETPEGGHELLGPGPSVCDTQGGAAGGADEDTSSAKQAVAESLGPGPVRLPGTGRPKTSSVRHRSWVLMM